MFGAQNCLDAAWLLESLFLGLERFCAALVTITLGLVHFRAALISPNPLP